MKRTKNRNSRRRRKLNLQLLDQRQLLAGDIELVDDGYTLQQNAPQISLDVRSNDRFSPLYEGAREITSVSTGSEGGQIRIADNGLTLLYTAPANFDGVEQFGYFVDGLESATVDVTIQSPLPDFEQVIYRLHDEYQLDLLENADFPADYFGEKRITLLGASSLGADLQLSTDGQSVTYRPPVGVTGRDSFTYIVDNRFFAIARVEIVNVMEHDRYQVLQHSETTNLNVLDNDFQDHGSDVADLADDATITHLISTSENFDVQITGEGRSVNFTPTANFYGTASFRYVVNSRFEQNVTVFVQRPVRDDYMEADQDGGPHTFDVLQNDSYRDYLHSNSLVDIVDVVTSVEQGDSGGTIAISNDGAMITYTPTVGFTGQETFRYTADGKYTATVRVNVTTPVRDDFQRVYFDTETAIDVLANDFLSDQSVDATITSIGDSNAGGTVRLSDGIIYYTPPNEIEPTVYGDNFQYTVNDTYTATVSVWFGSITSADSIYVDRPTDQRIDVLDNDQFDDGYQGDQLITSVSTPSDGGTVTISSDGRSLNYTPGRIGETFEYTVDDRFTETVTSRPIYRLSPDSSVADQNSDSITIDVLANDFSSTHVDDQYGPYTGDRALTGVSTSEAGGTVGIVNGKVRYEPATDFVGQDRFEYIVDGFLTSTVTVNVIRRSDDDVIRVDPDSQDNQLNVLVNDLLGADYAGAGAITSVTSSGGSASVAADGRSLIYTPDQGFTGIDELVYTVDGRSKATVTVHVADQVEALPKFESIEQLRDHLLELSIDRWYGDHPYYGDWELGPRTSSDAVSLLGFSETNVQVAGVDEDDLVETDGDFIYSLRGDELAIVSSLEGGEMELLSQTPVEGHAIGMYLSGDRLTVVSRLFEEGYGYVPGAATDSLVARDYILPPRPTDVTTIVHVFDVGDRAEPSLVHQTRLDGDFTSSRRIDDQVFLVLNSGDLFFEPENVTNDDGNTARETEEQFIVRVQQDYAELLEGVLPAYETFDSDFQIVRSGQLVVPEDIFFSGEDAGSMTVVVSLNMATTEPGLAASSGVMTSKGGSIYANAESLYIFKPDADKQDGQPATQILQFDWDGQTGAIDFAATGTVAGTVLNQFSADQQEDILRITTSISNSGVGTFSGNTETGIFTLQNDNGSLEFVGSLQNVAPGEDVKSVRYFGDRAFVTTFRTIDPLFAIDLSDAADPRVMGHASIPGFSSYAQVISEDRLLTVGSDQGSAIVSLFDISDFAKPELVDLYQLPRHTTSEANFDHHAFGWFAPHEILAIPTGQNFYERFDEDDDGYPEATRRVQRDALTMLHVGVDDISGNEGVSLRGSIQHDAKVIRSVYIGNHVYSVGIDAVRAVLVGAEETVVDEVVYPLEPGQTDPPSPTPLGSLSEFGAAARQMHADAMEIDAGSVMIVAQEASGEMIETVLRVGGDHYRYGGEGADDLSLIDDAFAFVDGWQNEGNQWDVNDDGEVTALDALLAINALGRLNGGDLPADRVMRQVAGATKYVDTNGDGKLTALDALRVINRLAVDDLQGEQTTPVVSIAHLSVGPVTGQSDDDESHPLTSIEAEPTTKI